MFTVEFNEEMSAVREEENVPLKNTGQVGSQGASGDKVHTDSNTEDNTEAKTVDTHTHTGRKQS